MVTLWLGNVDSDWFNAANWDGRVPTSADIATILSGGVGSFQPIISGNAVAASLSLNFPLALSSGSLSVSGTINIASSLTVSGGVLTAGGISGSGTLSNNTSTPIVVGGAGVTSLFQGTLQGTAGVTKVGIGFFDVAGTISDTGPVDIQGGFIRLYAGTTSQSSNYSIASGATLVLYSGSSIPANSDISGAGSWTINDPTSIGSLSGSLNVQYGANVTLTTGSNNQNDTYSGVLGFGSPDGSLAKIGTGTFTLQGANVYTGTTTVSAGILNIQNSSALGTTASGTTVASGATLQIQGGISVGAEALSIAGTGVSNGGALENLSGSNTYAGAITLTNASSINSDAGSLTLSSTSGISGAYSLTLGGAGSGTVAGPISTGAHTLTKSGSGTWVLSGDSTYSGVTVANGGPLIITGSLGNTPVLVGASGSLAGAATGVANSGTIANSVTVFGSLSAGATALSDVGTLRTGTLTINAAGTFREDVASNAAADKIFVTGLVNLDGTLDLHTAGSFADAIGQRLVFIDNDGTADAVSGTFSALKINGTTTALSGSNTFVMAGHTYQLSYTAGDGNDVGILDVTPPAASPDPGYTISTDAHGNRIINLTNASALTASLGTDGIDTVVFSGSGNITLPSNIENIIVSGGGSGTITGSSNSNQFTINGGNWTINGNGGGDTVVLNSPAASHTFFTYSGGTVVNGAEGSETIQGIAAIQFSDAKVIFDGSTGAKQVFSLYEATFGREPDVFGEGYWVNMLNKGTSLAAIGSQFAQSAEFQAKFGSSTNNNDFVTALYQNILHRGPDSAGLSYWAGLLNGGEPRGQMLVDFALAGETQAHIVQLVGQPIPLVQFAA